MTVRDVQGHFLIQIPAVPLLWRLKREATLISFFHICPGGNRESALVFSLQNDYESVCACYICLTLPQEARSLKGRPLRVIAKKRQPWNRTYTKLPPPIFLLPLTNEDIIVDLSPSSTSISPFLHPSFQPHVFNAD